MASTPTTVVDPLAAPERAARRRALEGHGALALVQLFFGLFPVVGRVAMTPGRGVSPWALATWRITAGALALGLVALLVHRRRMWPGGRDLAWLAFYALLGIVANQGLFVVGLARSTATNAALLICLIPVLTFSIAALAGREAFSWRRGLGVVIAFLASLPLLVARGGSLDPEHATGNLLLVANMVCYALYLVFSKPLLRRHPPLVVIAWVYLLSLPWLPLFALQGPLGPVAPSPAVWWSLAYVLVFPTVLAYLFNMFALARLEASTTAFYVFAQPLVTVVAAWWILGEALHPRLRLTALGLVVGLALVVKPGGAGSRGLVLRQPS